ncbi:MAG: hypothetical protein LBI33_06300 [Propionibacteriaceae bacterium]|jgi:hypothetical protein|nr:hypothetical protein [Propionibacteriaceae bacterium]
MRFLRLVAAVLGVFLLAGCTEPAPGPQPTPDFLVAGHAADMIDQLIAAAGTNRVINLELTRTEVRLTAIAGQSAVTYAYRDGQIAPIDSDVAFVGQAIFDPRKFALSDIGTLFTQAAAIAGSTAGQQLQIVDYNNGDLYITVTTNPETRPVFFTPAGDLIGVVDPADPAQLAPALDEVLERQVVRVTVSSTGSVSADVAAGPGQVLHIVRTSGFPVRGALKTEAAPPEPFTRAYVTAATVETVLAGAEDALGRPLADGYELTIERPAGEEIPTATVTMGLKSVHLTLDGVVIPR